MILKLKRPITVEDPQGHSRSAVQRLLALLESGVRAEPDARHDGCYNLEDDTRAYYIYISRLSGRVVLLATGLKEPASIPDPRAANRASFASLVAV